LSYKKTINQEESQELASTEDFYTLAQILEFNGLRFADFPEERAKQIGLQLVADNQKEFMHSGEVKKHHTMDILDKHYYVQSGGLTKKRKLHKQEMLVKTSENNKEIAKAGLEGLLVFEDGNGAASSLGAAAGVKSEVPGLLAFKEKLSALKALLSSLQKLGLQGLTLAKKMEVHGRKDEATKLKKEELDAKLLKFNEFVDQCATSVAEGEDLLEQEDADFTKEVANVNRMLSTVDHHSGGCKEMLRRFSSMMGK